MIGEIVLKMLKMLKITELFIKNVLFCSFEHLFQCTLYSGKVDFISKDLRVHAILLRPLYHLQMPSLPTRLLLYCKLSLSMPLDGMMDVIVSK